MIKNQKNFTDNYIIGMNLNKFYTSSFDFDNNIIRVKSITIAITISSFKLSLTGFPL